MAEFFIAWAIFALLVGGAVGAVAFALWLIERVPYVGIILLVGAASLLLTWMYWADTHGAAS